MLSDALYITRLAAWAPGIENSGEWDEWAQGKRSISPDSKGPELSFTDSMFRRRLSQISKMTVQVIHDLLPLKEDTKLFFISFRGELARQYQINKMLIEEKELLPAAFSLSVFNAPAALASIALGLKGGYAALYPTGNNFAAGLAAAQAALLCGSTTEIAFVYADEAAPPEYEAIAQAAIPPAAFGFLLSRNPESLSVPLSSLTKGENSPTAEPVEAPLHFLKKILLYGDIHAAA